MFSFVFMNSMENRVLMCVLLETGFGLFTHLSQKRSWVVGFDCERTRIRDVHESYKKYDFDSCSTRGLGILELK